MGALKSKARKRLASAAAVACSLGFVFQIVWLALLIIQKWAGGIHRPTVALELQTDLLFLISIVLSVVATIVNDWGWHHLNELKRRLPVTLAILIVLGLAFGAKTQAMEDPRMASALVPYLDLVQATIWLTLLNVGLRAWHQKNGEVRSSHPLLSRKIRWVMLVKTALLSLLWLAQAFWLACCAESLPPWGSCSSDVLYLVGMVCSWVSYMERRYSDLLKGLKGDARDDREVRPPHPTAE